MRTGMSRSVHPNLFMITTVVPPLRSAKEEVSYPIYPMWLKLFEIVRPDHASPARAHMLVAAGPDVPISRSCVPTSCAEPSGACRLLEANTSTQSCHATFARQSNLGRACDLA